MAKRLAGYDWTEIEAWVWRVYLRYGLSYAPEFHEWVEEAKGIRPQGLEYKGASLVPRNQVCQP